MPITEKDIESFTPQGSDSIDIEVIRNELEAMVDEMKITIRRTGRSPLVKVGDFAVTLCDSQGRAIGLGQTGLSHPALYALSRRVFEVGGPFAEGDVFITNDPYAGGSHIPDLAVICPIRHEGDLVGFATAYSHHTDMGGRVPGSQSGACRESYEEGLHIPIVRIYAGGKRQEDLLNLVLANVRGREEFIGDVEAKIGGCRRVGEQLGRLIERHGRAAFDRCCQYLNDRSEAHLRAAIAKVPAGIYSSEVALHDDGFGPLERDESGEQPSIRLTLEVSPEGLVVDFAGTAAQMPGGVNMPFENTRGMVLSALKDVLAPEVELNEGFDRLVEIRAPEGTIVKPIFPAATAGRAPTLFLLEEAIFRALAKALPDKVPVPREWYDVVHYSGQRDDGSDFAIMDLFSGGWGARPDKDGPDGISATPSTSLPVELLEREYPLLIESFGLVPDSGGAGRYRGSQAVERRYRFMNAGRVMTRTNRTIPTDGLYGGGAGQPSGNRFHHGGKADQLVQRAFHHLDVQPGDVLVHRIGGCGGYGDPAQRDPEAVKRDVREGRVSAACATENYRSDWNDGADNPVHASAAEE